MKRGIDQPTSAPGWSLSAVRTSSRDNTISSANPHALTSAVRLTTTQHCLQRDRAFQWCVDNPIIRRIRYCNSDQLLRIDRTRGRPVWVLRECCGNVVNRRSMWQLCTDSSVCTDVSNCLPSAGKDIRESRLDASPGQWPHDLVVTVNTDSSLYYRQFNIDFHRLDKTVIMRLIYGKLTEFVSSRL